MDKFEPIEAQDCINEIADYLLGENWCIIDPVCNTQANAIILNEIKRKYKPKDKTDTYKYRESHRSCKYCQYNIFKSSPPLPGMSFYNWQECQLSDKTTKNIKAKFCKFYKVKE